MIDIILTLFVWSAFGLAMVVFTGFFDNSIINQADGMEFVNPIFIYKHTVVNWFGAFLLMIILNLLCPIGSVIYWLYKICTIGRK